MDYINKIGTIIWVYDSAKITLQLSQQENSTIMIAVITTFICLLFGVKLVRDSMPTFSNYGEKEPEGAQGMVRGRGGRAAVMRRLHGGRGAGAG